MRREARLTAAELADRASTTVERVHELVDAGVLQPDARGRHAPADAGRIRIAEAYERGGIELRFLADAIRGGFLSFEFADRIYPNPSPDSGKVLGDLMVELGAAGALLPEVLLAMGLAQPSPERPLTEADIEALREFVGAWAAAPLAAGAALRAARLAGDATRRAAAGWTELFVEAVNLPPEVSTEMTIEELGPRMFEPAIRVAGVFEPTLVWLLRHHLEQALNVANVEAMERALEIQGLRPHVDRAPPAVVFADISGFTRLTDEHGDDVAVRHAESLSALATGIAASHAGRLVKQLGDGVILLFNGPHDAAEAATELVSAAERAGVPSLHVGISAGPVVERDGDVYGRTVNLAARLSGVAGAGEIVLNDAAAMALDGGRVSAASAADLKGFAKPVAVYRLVRD